MNNPNTQKLTFRKLDDNSWNGRHGYDTYYIPGSKEDAKAFYVEHKPVPQASPSLHFEREIPADSQLLDVNGEPFVAPEDGWKIKIERWAI